MKYLSGTITGLTGDEGIGVMVNRRAFVLERLDPFPFWAVDNDCYNAGASFDPAAWLTWLATVPTDRSLFAVAPDVVGDAAATAERSRPHLEAIRRLGHPAAYVAQDGLDPDTLAWDTFDVLFVGGTDTYKESPASTAAIRAAQAHGKATHAGRVNSRRRFRHFAGLGVDTADGTFLAFGPERRRAELIGWTREHPLPLEGPR